MIYTYDLAPDDPGNPVAGDYYVTARYVYRITFARPVNSKVWSNRWRLECTRVGDRASFNFDYVDHDTTNVWFSARYQRGEGPADVFAHHVTVNASRTPGAIIDSLLRDAATRSDSGTWTVSWET